MSDFQKINLRQKNRELFGAADEILQFSYSSIGNVERLGRNRTLDTTQAVSALFVKCVRLFNSTILLAEQGLRSLISMASPRSQQTPQQSPS